MSKCKVTIFGAGSVQLVTTGVPGEVAEVAETYERFLASDIKTFNSSTPTAVVVVQTCNVLAIRVEPDNVRP